MGAITYVRIPELTRDDYFRIMGVATGLGKVTTLTMSAGILLFGEAERELLESAPEGSPGRIHNRRLWLNGRWYEINRIP